MGRFPCSCSLCWLLEVETVVVVVVVWDCTPVTASTPH